MRNEALLIVANLRVAFHTRNGVTRAVDDVSFVVRKGEVLGIVGESGSGKSVACYSLLGLIPTPPGKIESGVANFAGSDLLQMNEQALRKIRGQKISMIFQDPMTSLNPYMRVVDQLVEPLRLHFSLNKKAARIRAIAALEEVGINDAAIRIDDYPHQFSGGMRQRVMIAMALIAEPELLIADEPTTALDVTVQAQILAVIKSLQQSRNLSVIFITHDLGVAAQMADHVLVMQEGRVVEQGVTQDIFHRPQHPYTQKLLSAVLTSAKSTQRTSETIETDFLQINRLHTSFHSNQGWLLSRIFGRNNRAASVKGVDDVTLTIHQGEILGLVGESGSGKSTLGRSIMQLIEADSGEVLLQGRDLCQLAAADLRRARRHFQMIFQDPYASLNPRMTVYETLAEPLLTHKLADKKSVSEQVNQLMDDVGLDRRFVRKYPHEFSGGQRQRIAIARALALKPKLIVADEPVSALDVTIRAQILELLLNLTRKHNLTMLFISHDMSVVRYLCDRVVVMRKGKIVEEGQTEALFSAPQHEYTRALLAAIPKLESV
jgi:ABC-type microcin C transport system duplicated ATPase subunit YejF